MLTEKLKFSHLVKKFPTFHVNRTFITSFTSSRHQPIFWARSLHSIHSHSSSWTSILITSFSQYLVFQVVSILQVSSPITCMPLVSPESTSGPRHLILLDLITRKILDKLYRSLSSSLCIFLYSSVTSSLLSTNILLSTPLSNTLSLRSSLNMSDQVSHPYKTTGKIVVLFIQIYRFLDSKI
jgi:hypothetical protein